MRMNRSFLCFLSVIISSSGLEQIKEISQLEWNNSVVGFEHLECNDAPKLQTDLPLVEAVLAPVTEGLIPLIEVEVPVIDTVLETVTENLVPVIETNVPVIETVLETVKDSIIPALETDIPVIETVLDTVKDNLVIPVLESVRKNKTESEDSLKSKLPFNFSWLIPGLLAGTNCPTTEEELMSIYDTGVRYLVTLSPEYQPKHHQLHPQNLPDLRHFNIFFDDFTAPTIESIVEFEKVCRKARQEGAPLAVHCRWGYGRTGTMLSLYLVTFLEMSPEDALLEVRFKRPWSVETKEQEQAIKDWAEFLQERKNLENERLKNVQQNLVDNVQQTEIHV